MHKRIFAKYLTSFIFIIATVSSLFLASQTISSAATDITYPISSLGNCTSASDCFMYCSQLDHQADCTSFAQSHALPSGSISSALLETAKAQLGCNSESECKTFCQQSSNFSACEDFAIQHDLVPQTQTLATIDTTVLSKATSLLGCSSLSSCAQFCSDTTHAQKCALFAQMYGLFPKSTTYLDMVTICNSAGSCQQLCTHTSNLCQGYHTGQTSVTIALHVPEPVSDQAQITLPADLTTQQGPGGCIVGQSCASYCETHISTCIQFYASGISTSPTITQIPQVTVPAGFAIPSICTGLSCLTYCLTHQDTCSQYMTNTHPSSTEPTITVSTSLPPTQPVDSSLPSITMQPMYIPTSQTTTPSY